MSVCRLSVLKDMPVRDCLSVPFVFETVFFHVYVQIE